MQKPLTRSKCRLGLTNVGPRISVLDGVQIPHAQEGALLSRHVSANRNVPTHEYIAHCLPAAAGECACLAHASDECICR